MFPCSFQRISFNFHTQIHVATKYMPWAWRLPVTFHLKTSLQRSLDRLNKPHIDLYQISSFANSYATFAWFADAMAAVYQQGTMTSRVNIFNFVHFFKICSKVELFFLNLNLSLWPMLQGWSRQSEFATQMLKSVGEISRLLLLASLKLRT
jgi:aryl-alcohol dehydrogenase-like predicted oxidoreductase